jgi:hypothetical protein
VSGSKWSVFHWNIFGTQQNAVSGSKWSVFHWNIFGAQQNAVVTIMDTVRLTRSYTICVCVTGNRSVYNNQIFLL